MAGMAFKGDSWDVVSKRHVSLQCTDLNAESNTRTLHQFQLGRQTLFSN